MRRIRPDEIARARKDPRLLDATEYRNAIRGSYRMSGEDWLRRGNCANADPEVIYPEPHEPIDEALAICANCPVRTPCLVRALEARDRYGIWGATAPRERRAMIEVWKELGAKRGSTETETWQDIAPSDPLA